MKKAETLNHFYYYELLKNLQDGINIAENPLIILKLNDIIELTKRKLGENFLFF